MDDREEIAFPTDSAGTITVDIYMDPYITPNTNINSKLVTDPSEKAKIIFLEENGLNLHDLGLGLHQN